MESAPLQKKDGPGKLIDWTIIVILWSGILLCYPWNLPVKNLNQHAASIDIGGGVGTPAIVGIDAMENEQSLPFVKNHLLCEDIHSMETYKKMTQKPHFAPLYEHIEEEREGLAVVLETWWV